MRLSTSSLAAALSLALLTFSAHAQEPNTVQRISTDQAAVDQDPYLWLEDVEGARQLDWVRQRNARAEAELTQSPAFAQIQSDLLAILDSDARIPTVTKIGDYYYNLWQDKNNPQGLWRRTTLEEYRKPAPQWDVLLDIDALNARENTNWVWGGADCLRPPQGQPYQRCMISLSRGGADATVAREFDLDSRSFVEGGFYLPEAKGGTSWIDRDTLFVFTDFGAGTMTDSGYPRTVRRWQRGQALADAAVVYEGQRADMYISAFHDSTPGFERSFVSRTLAFYNDELYLINADGQLQKVDVPNSTSASVERQWLVLEPREDWTVAGTTWKAGSLLVANFDDWMAGKRTLTALFTPTETTSLAGSTWTQNHVVVNVLDDVKNRLYVMTPGENGWQRSEFVGAPDIGTVSVRAVDSDTSDAVWMTVADYLTPTTLSLAEIGQTPQQLKSMPAFFDAAGYTVAQHFATSKDGTRVPYFIVHAKDMPLNGRNPTLLYGYGGFEISLTPSYAATVGKGWLEHGGVYVVANIRGGGEYGPRWHQAALKQNRHKAYEDFAAVAQDLIARNITAPQHLGVQGGSNGGLLTGNMLTQYPDLFGAVVIQVPLLDMRRYNQLLAGASWMAEYGNPDTDDWQFIQNFSPYHLFDPARNYPATLITTSTRDDRVHPAHARKMAALMEAAGKDVRYYENIEGGHGGAANNAQRAHMLALIYSFLLQQLKN